MRHDLLLERAGMTAAYFLLFDAGLAHHWSAISSHVVERVLVCPRVHDQNDRGLLCKTDRLLLATGGHAGECRSFAPDRIHSVRVACNAVRRDR